MFRGGHSVITMNVHRKVLVLNSLIIESNGIKHAFQQYSFSQNVKE